MKKYFIKDGYIIRENNDFFDDTPNKDEYQDEVYKYVKNKLVEYNYNSVIDVGCGSAFKLIKYFNNNKTIGIDLEPTVSFLRNKYNDKEWTIDFKPLKGYDIIIAGDIIEHMIDPDELLDLINDSEPKLIFISTPNRDLLPRPGSIIGPPNNKSHVREWNFEEFNDYISSRFSVIEHFISKGATQVILAKINNNNK